MKSDYLFYRKGFSFTHHSNAHGKKREGKLEQSQEEGKLNFGGKIKMRM